jgi:hypothetical protein
MSRVSGDVIVDAMAVIDSDYSNGKAAGKSVGKIAKEVSKKINRKVGPFLVTTLLDKRGIKSLTHTKAEAKAKADIKAKAKARAKARVKDKAKEPQQLSLLSEPKYIDILVERCMKELDHLTRRVTKLELTRPDNTRFHFASGEMPKMDPEARRFYLGEANDKN